MIPGRIVRVKDSHNKIDYGWGIVVNFSWKIINLKSQKKVDGLDGSKPQVIIDVLLYLDKKLNSQNQIQPADPWLKQGILGVVPVTLATID